MCNRPVRILHAHSTFALGGKEARAVRLMNAFSDRAHHVIWSGMPDRTSAREAIAPDIVAGFPADAPPLVGRPTPQRLKMIAAYMRDFDLVLTYNWGAFDAVMAKRLFGKTYDLPPLVHHEDGFNEDEAASLKPARNLYRRIGLAVAHALVVPSRRLAEIAATSWGQPTEQLHRIPNGIDVGRYMQALVAGAIPGFIRQPGEVVVGTVSGLRIVKNLPRLVRLFAAASTGANARLVIAGEGPDRHRILAAAREAGVADRVLLPGFLPDPARWIGHFDIFALSSDSEQFPISLIEAMAAGLPALSTDVGDVHDMLSRANRFAVGDEPHLGAVLSRLIAEPDLRRELGEANRQKAVARFDERLMIGRYAALYGEAIGNAHAFGAPQQGRNLNDLPV